MVQASTTGEAAATGYSMIEMRPAGAVCSALPHTVSQDLHANHDGQPARSRQGDGWQAGKQAARVCVVSPRLISSLLLCAPSASRAGAAVAHFFFCVVGFQKILGRC